MSTDRAPTAPTTPATDAPATRRGCAAPLILVGISLLLALLAAEVALRITGFAATGRGSQWFAGGNHPRFLFEPDPRSGYTLRPGFHGTEVGPAQEFVVPVRVDARGLRDHAHTAPPRPLVLALGDSMTYGEGVRDTEAWPAVLERTGNVRVVDAGVPGYGSPQMLGRMQALARALRPDLVVVALSPRWDRQRCAEPFVYKDGFIVASGYAAKLHTIGGNLYLADVKWPVIGPATAYAKRWSHVARLLLPAMRRSAGTIAGEHRHDPAVEPVDPLPTADNLARMAAEARTQGASFLVFLLDSLGPEYARDRDALLPELRRRGIAWVDADSFQSPARWRPLHFPRDRHWNAGGHRVAGEAMVEPVRAALATPAASITSPR